MDDRHVLRHKGYSNKDDTSKKRLAVLTVLFVLQSEIIKNSNKRYNWKVMNPAGEAYLKERVDILQGAKTRSNKVKRELYQDGISRGKWPKSTVWENRVYTKIDNLAGRVTRQEAQRACIAHLGSQLPKMKNISKLKMHFGLC